jgi:hypothetical protein
MFKPGTPGALYKGKEPLTEAYNGSIKKMEADYEALKLKMVQDYDKLIEIEKRFEASNKIILKRLKKEV